MAPAVYLFGAFELDVPRLELRRSGKRVALQPKALDLLIYLVRHRDRVVSKDELLDALWPDVVVTEASLSKAVYAARRALDVDDVEASIVTIRGRGLFETTLRLLRLRPIQVFVQETECTVAQNRMAAVEELNLGAIGDAKLGV